ncbi:MAG: hypothetical protein JW958_12805 [Candidatus Eisenbacteria bacterium]|nr:hypothetical protein [Candidatus Eisenbacteria bacterium]
MTPLRFREIFRFYLPLMLTSQMMTLSGPLINMGVGRSADPKPEFAGFWLGFTVTMFIESPTLIMQPVSAALIGGKRSLRRLVLVSALLGLAAAAVILLVALTPAGGFLFSRVIPTTERAAVVARRVMIVLSPVPIWIAFRAVANALALREKRTGLIAMATGCRLLVIAILIALAAGGSLGVPGAESGALALTAGIAVETLFIAAATRRFWRGDRAGAPAGDDPDLPYREIVAVAFPLAVSAWVWSTIRPLINAILGLLPDPELAQAGFGVVTPLLLLTSSALWALQNVTLILPECREDLRKVLHFAAAATFFFIALITLFLFTPIRDLLLDRFFNLSIEMRAVVAPALFLILLEPLFLTARASAQGLLVRARRTGVFSVISLGKILVLGLTGYLAVRTDPSLNGAFLATALFVGGELFDGVFYVLKARSVVLSGGLFAHVAPAPAGAAPEGDPAVEA